MTDKPPPFKLREQMLPYNQEMPWHIVKCQVGDNVYSGDSPHNSPLMLSFHAGLLVGLTAQGLEPKDVWIEECEAPE